MNRQSLLCRLAVAQDFSASPHGRLALPEGPWEYVIVAISIVTLLLALYLGVKYFLTHREENDDHIKVRVLDDKDPSGR